MMTASDIFRLFGLVGNKQDDPFLSLGPPPPLSLQSLLPGADLCDPLTDAGKHSKPVELKIPKHVTGMSHHHKDAVSVGMQHQQPGRVKHSAGHHNGRHGRDQAPPPPAQTPGAPRQSQPAAAVGPSDQELIQSGIDPEAYCELCQKEFCSKYFLRTHRQKIHGVSASKTDPSFDHYRPQAAAAANPVLQMFPGLPLPTQPLFGPGPTGLMPSAPVVDPSPDAIAAVSSQGRGSAKEAANATRVTCDVCGKELCNKYFLKTHMAKIHGYTTAPGCGTVELDVGDTVQDVQEKRALPSSADDHTPHSSPSYEKYPPAGGSFPNLTDHGNIPPAPPADNMPPHRSHSRNYLQPSNDIQPRDSSENAVSRVKTSLDHPRSTQAASCGSEAAEQLLENGERSLPETIDEHSSTMDAEHSSANLDIEHSFELAAQHDKDVAQQRGEKRATSAAAVDDDRAMKRSRTDCLSDTSASTDDAVPEIQADHLDADDHDAAASSGVIHFLGRSKDPAHRPAESCAVESSEKAEGVSSWPGTSAEFSDSTNVKQSQSNSLSGGSDHDGRWSTTVNGHSDRDVGSSSQSADDQQPQPAPLMQPFIMRQEPPPPAPSPGSAGESAGDTTQFAACQLVLPVVRPIRDPLTVEFSVTPVSSD